MAELAPPPPYNPPPYTSNSSAAPSTIMSTTDRILASRKSTSRLLAELSATKSDHRAYTLLHDRATNLTEELDSLVIDIEILDSRTKMTLRSWQSLKMSNVRRQLWRWMGCGADFEDIAEAKEEIFQEAWQAEKDAREEAAQLRLELNEIAAARQRVEDGWKAHEHCQEDLDELFDGIFNEPMAEFPEHEVAKSRLKFEEGNYQRLAKLIKDEEQALSLLSEAGIAFHQAMCQLRNASFAILNGIVGKCDEASRAQRTVNWGYSLISEARQYAPMVRKPAVVNVLVAYNTWGDWVCNSISEEGRIRREMGDAMQRLEHVIQGNRVQVDLAKQRVRSWRSNFDEASDRWFAARWELQRVRIEIVERIGSRS